MTSNNIKKIQRKLNTVENKPQRNWGNFKGALEVQEDLALEVQVDLDPEVQEILAPEVQEDLAPAVHLC